MGELTNCKHCGNVFVKQVREVCPDCHREIERDFQTVYEFIKVRKNRTATISEITDATGVEESLIHKFIKEKRLRPSQFPNLSYPCEKCGKGIGEGKMCRECAREINSALEEQGKIDAVEERNRLEKRQNSAYYSEREK